MTDTGLELGPKSLDSSIGEFNRENNEYYTAEFSKIQSTRGFPWSWNTMAAVFGPSWVAVRGAWGFFWTFLVLELSAFVQIGRGLWGELGADQLARHRRLLGNIAKREQQAADLTRRGKRVKQKANLRSRLTSEKSPQSPKREPTSRRTRPLRFS